MDSFTLTVIKLQIINYRLITTKIFFLNCFRRFGNENANNSNNYNNNQTLIRWNLKYINFLIFVMKP